MSLSPISLAFQKCKDEKRPALLTYTVSGDPSKKISLEILKTISKNVDIIELGFAHNTPIADGGEIQNSAYRAIKNGTKIDDTFEIIRKFKKTKNAKPIIKMGYWNLILQYGENRFLKKCKQVGVNGLIVVDLPYPENKIFANKCKKSGITFVQLLSPTTSNKRMKKIIKDSHDMLYYISMLSTTGGKLKVSSKEILRNYRKIKDLTINKYCVIGFGITEKNISSLKSADGLVVGSLNSKIITNSLKKKHNPVTKLDKMINILKNKITK
jgi:tryptophan synthase alpha chain